MIQKIYSLRDAAVEAFLQPFFAPTDGAAIRSLTQAVNDPNHDVSKNARDYSLWILAEFDDHDGQIVPMSPVRHLINCIELINKG